MASTMAVPQVNTTGQAAVNAAAGDEIGNAFPSSRKVALPALQYSGEYLAGGSVVNGRSKKHHCKTEQQVGDAALEECLHGRLAVQRVIAPQHFAWSFAQLGND